MLHPGFSLSVDPTLSAIDSLSLIFLLRQLMKQLWCAYASR